MEGTPTSPPSVARIPLDVQGFVSRHLFGTVKAPSASALNLKGKTQQIFQSLGFQPPSYEIAKTGTSPLTPVGTFGVLQLRFADPELAHIPTLAEVALPGKVRHGTKTG